MAGAMRSLFPLARFVHFFTVVFLRRVFALFQLSDGTMVFSLLWHWTKTST